MQRLANQYLFAKRKPRPRGLENETRAKCRKLNQKHGGKEQQKQVEQIMFCKRIPIGFGQYRQVGALVRKKVSNPFTASVMKWKRDLFLNGW